MTFGDHNPPTKGLLTFLSFMTKDYFSSSNCSISHFCDDYLDCVVFEYTKNNMVEGENRRKCMKTTYSNCDLMWKSRKDIFKGDHITFAYHYYIHLTLLYHNKKSYVSCKR